MTFQRFSKSSCWLAVLALAPAVAWSETASPTNASPEQTAPPAVVASAEAITNPLVTANSPSLTNIAPDLAAAISNLPTAALTEEQMNADLRTRLELARHLRRTRQPQEAEPILVELLGKAIPDNMKQQALLELAMAAREQGELPRAQQVYAQFLGRWPNDLLVPEILLTQGQIFRQMGLNNLALAKFYGVMTSALVLKNDKLEFYQKLVLSAQMEIAETHYLLGKYAESAEFYTRLIKQNSPALNRQQAQFRLVRSLAALGKNDEAIAQGQDYLIRFPGTPEQPEVRFHLSVALKQLGRNTEALQQVLALLQEQKALTATHPETWAYWQQRAGNEVANQLYREGDYVKALDIYLSLAQLDSQLAWRLPVTYQIGLTYERLAQPTKAEQSYQEILHHETELGTNASPGLQAIFDMARWRTGFLQWQGRAETQTRPPTLPQASSLLTNPPQS